MKKIVLAAAIVAFSVSASAKLGAFVDVEYDNANSGQALNSQYEVRTGVTYATKLGMVDGALLGKRIRSNIDDNGLGFEIGYTNGLQVGPVAVTGRLGYGRVNRIETTGAGGFSGNSEYYSIGVQGALPVTKTLTATAGFRHRNALDADTPAAANRFAVGLSFSPLSKLTINTALTHTRQAGVQFNGLAVNTNLSF